ncbi:hypothetical protein JNB88_22740 [Rhizobium cauense]|uniref:hypothetical protein n=1 Tax=Rhizobium cauense TaxID=1166683 RepID=UPI001C6EB7FB|nr:hypothetical protein [Rhizobium cauense]MBW9116458.1 hypothetical protein [Rhizobium cauense]
MFRRNRYTVAKPSAGGSYLTALVLVGLVLYAAVVVVVILQRGPEATVKVYVPMASEPTPMSVDRAIL